MITKRTIIALCFTVVLFGLISTFAGASKYHEDPAEIQEDFSGMSLLLYYSELLDKVRLGDFKDVEGTISKLEYANVPSIIKNDNAAISSSSTELFQSITSLSIAWEKYRLLIERVQPFEIQQMVEQVSREIGRSKQNLESISRSIETIGKYLKIDNLPPSNGLKLVYDDIIEKTGRLQSFIENVDTFVDQHQDLINKLKATNLSLKAEPNELYPGDEMAFSGFLSSGSIPMADREIDIRLEDTHYATVRSDATGFFQGAIRIPYHYFSEMSLQAIYLPSGQDAAIYQGSISPIRQLRIMLYQADLNINIAGIAYPGRDISVAGELGYAPGTPLEYREAEIYLDDLLLEEFIIKDSFLKEIRLDPTTSSGNHSLIIIVKPTGRYSPVSKMLPLDVTMAVPVLEMATPGKILLPGKMNIGGRVNSETGPLKNASIRLNIRNSSALIKTDDEGRFETEMLLGPGFDLMGNDTLSIDILPEEPWNQSLSVAKNIFTINLPNCAILLVLLAGLGYLLPRRLKLFTKHSTAAKKKRIISPVPEAESISAASITQEMGDNQIFYLYRVVLRLVSSITRAIMKPHQTLREFAGENNTGLGSLSRYFNEFTRLIERLIYSKHKATDADLQKSRELYESMEREAHHEDI